MIIKEVEVVINVEYGGFSLDTEMALWLMENKGWTSTNVDSGEDETEFDLISLGDMFLRSKKYDEVGFRMNPDLVECVKTLQKKHEGTNWSGVAYNDIPKVLQLNVVHVEVHLTVEPVYDGIENIACWSKM